MQAALLVDGVTVTLQDRERQFTLAVDGLSIRPGEAIGLTGASGTGKTLLLEVLGLLRQPDARGNFTVDVNGTLINLRNLWLRPRAGGAGVTRVRGNLFGFVPQTGGLVPFINVRDNAALSQRISGRLDESFLDNLLERLGIAALARQLPASLSIGQRQRVSIARALAHRPAYLIADEPTAALDPENAAEAIRLLLDATRESGSALILSSHDIGMLDALPLSRYELHAISHPSGVVTSRILRGTAP